MANEGTPFDDVFKTLLEKCTDLIIPVLNEVFGTDYKMSEKAQKQYGLLMDIIDLCEIYY